MKIEHFLLSLVRMDITLFAATRRANHSPALHSHISKRLSNRRFNEETDLWCQPENKAEVHSTIFVEISALEPFLIRIFFSFIVLTCFSNFCILFNYIFIRRIEKREYWNDCLVSVDGIDFWIHRAGCQFYSFKYKKSELCYEVDL